VLVCLEASSHCLGNADLGGCDVAGRLVQRALRMLGEAVEQVRDGCLADRRLLDREQVGIALRTPGAKLDGVGLIEAVNGRDEERVRARKAAISGSDR
jgi:hypothetical protein